ncbi:MAG: hypothetical protein GY805_39350 [Chloroflexi bacterium]|nr:hypothetical protein [Chloroflexota bacterium]
MEANNTNNNRNENKDNLQEIKGIGPDYEQALNQLGVLTFAQLAVFKDAQQLYKALKESGNEIPLWKIEKFDWIGQASTKLKNQKKSQNAEEANDSRHNQNQVESNEEHAAFIVSFDRHTSEDGEEIWSIVVSYATTNEPLTNFSIPYRKNPTAWLKWIFEDAVKTEKIDSTNTELMVTHVPAAEIGKQLNLVDVQIKSPSPASPQKELMARIHFELLGSDVEVWTEERLSYRLELYLLNLESQITEPVASSQKRLEPGILEYEIGEAIPIPSSGRHELYVLLFLLPPAEIMATHQGPIINVVPHPVNTQ